MNTKYILLLISTLILGVAIGVIATGRITKNRIERIKSFNTREGFQEHFFRLVQADEALKEKLKPILNEYGERQRALMNANREEQKTLLDEMESEIKPYLNAVQLKKLEEHKARLMEHRENDRHPDPNRPPKSHH